MEEIGNPREGSAESELATAILSLCSNYRKVADLSVFVIQTSIKCFKLDNAFGHE